VSATELVSVWFRIDSFARAAEHFRSQDKSSGSALTNKFGSLLYVRIYIAFSARVVVDRLLWFFRYILRSLTHARENFELSDGIAGEENRLARVRSAYAPMFGKDVLQHSLASGAWYLLHFGGTEYNTICSAQQIHFSFMRTTSFLSVKREIYGTEGSEIYTLCWIIHFVY